MKDRYKFIELDGQKYRIEKMPARTALYIGSQLAMALVEEPDPVRRRNRESIQKQYSQH